MEKQHIHDILIAKDIRKTKFRVELLKVFLESKHALSFKSIKDKITSTKDKVTIYRALAIFEQKGLIHKVPSASDVSTYALYSTKHAKEAHNHAHFICNQCEQTFCIDDIELPVFKNIQGYEIQKMKLTLEGNCPDCPPV